MTVKKYAIQRTVPDELIANDTQQRLFGLPSSLERELVAELVIRIVRDKMVEFCWERDDMTGYQRVGVVMYVGKLNELEKHEIVETQLNEDNPFVTNPRIRRF
jgi:hypothetical protein